MRKTLYRSQEQQMIGGVCGGLAEHFDIDPTWLRLLAVLLIFASGFGLVAYLVAWIIIPRGPLPQATAAAAAANAQVIPPTPPRATSSAPARSPGMIIGIVLVLVGLIFLFDHLFFWFDWAYVWPLVLIGLGVVLVYHSIKPQSHRHDSTASSSAEVINGRR
jgi:phage shock protein PspC (stress-responsive transcriptional regulator)